MKRKILILTGSIAVIVATILIYLSTTRLNDFAPAIKSKLQNLVIKGSDSLYLLSYDTLEYDILQSKLVVKNITFSPDSVRLLELKKSGNLSNDIFKVALKQVVIEGIDIKDFISSKNIDLDSLQISQPKIEIYHAKKKDTTQPKSLKTVYQNIAGIMNRISLKHLEINNMIVVQTTFQNEIKFTTTTYNNVNLLLNHILIDSTTQFDESRFMYAKEAFINMYNQEWRTSDSLYIFKMESINIDAAKKNAAVKNLTFKPRYNKTLFVKKLPFVKDRYEMLFKSLNVYGIDWWGFINSESLSINKATAQQGKLSIFLDRRLPPYPGSKVGNYPHQMLMKLKLPIHIGAFTISNLNLDYEEFNPVSNQSGVLHFSNLNGNITNITNIKSSIEKKPLMNLVAEGKFLNLTNMYASIVFNLQKVNTGDFSAKINFTGFNALGLNSISQPLGLVKLASGNITEASAIIKGNDNGGFGTVKIIYNDLQLKLLKKGDDSHLKERKLLNVLANFLVVKNENPSNNETRIEKVMYVRNIKQSFFSVLFKTFLKGILQSIGLGIAAGKLK